MFKIFTIATLMFLIIPNVNASNNIEVQYIDDVYSNRIINGETMSGKFGYIYIDSQLGFCIDPLKIVGNNYEIDDSKIDEYYTKEEQRQLKLIIHYGANTHLNNYYYYMATQELIWRIKGGDFYFTDINGERIDIEIYKDEIMEKVLKHDLLPSFSNIVLNPKLYDEVILNDDNKVLKNYIISNPGNNKVTKKDDSMIININDKMVSNIELTYTVSSGLSSHTYIGNGQTLITSRLAEQKTTYVHVEPSGVSYYLKIKFLEGDKSIFGKVKFKIYNHNISQYIENGTIFESNMFGVFESDFKLDVGIYEIAYIDVPNGYIPSILPNQFTLDNETLVNNNFKYEFISYLDVPKGKLTINRTATTYDGNTKKLDGIEYKIFARNNISDVHSNLLYKQDELVDTIKVIDGSIDIMLPLGSYYIEEQPNNYGIEQSLKQYVNFTYNDSITNIYYQNININTPISTPYINIKTLKETINGNYIDYSNYKYEMYALEDIIYLNELVFSKGEHITTLISDDNGNIMKNLEISYGKYILKEINIDNNYYDNENIIFNFTNENNYLYEIVEKKLKKGNLEIIINSENQNIHNIIYFLYDKKYNYNINYKLLIENIKIGEYKVIYDKEYDVIIYPNETTLLEINIESNKQIKDEKQEDNLDKENINEQEKNDNIEDKSNDETKSDSEDIKNNVEIDSNKEIIKEDNIDEENNVIDEELKFNNEENNKDLSNEKLDNNLKNNNDEKVEYNKIEINEEKIDNVLPNTYNYFKKWYLLFDSLIILGLIFYAKKN